LPEISRFFGMVIAMFYNDHPPPHFRVRYGRQRGIVEVEVTRDQCLRLKFEDGVEGEVDVAALVPFEGIFAPLRDPKLFAAVEVDRELGTIRWPNGADLDPDVLYAVISGQPTPDLSRAPTRTPA